MTHKILRIRVNREIIANERLKGIISEIVDGKVKTIRNLIPNTNN